MAAPQWQKPKWKGQGLLSRLDVTFRAQPHATFKLLFNGIDDGSAQTVSLVLRLPLPCAVLQRMIA